MEGWLPFIISLAASALPPSLLQIVQMWSVSAKTSIPIITRKCKWEHEPSLICAHPQPFVPWRSPWWQHVTGLFKKRKGTRASFFKLEDEWRRRAALQVKRNTVITAISKREVCKHDKRALKSLLWKIKLKMHTVSVMCERNTSEQSVHLSEQRITRLTVRFGRSSNYTP